MNTKRMIAAAAGIVLAASAFAQTENHHPSWLKDAVVYQIYPSSFQDSDGNGIGDLPGIISRLDYIKSIGVSAIWMNPIFVSGWTDGGYDIIDFYKVDPENILVIYDDIDLPLGKLRVRKNGGPGTHNGMRSIVSSLNSQDFPRIRVGTGGKPDGWDLADWVLSHYTAEDKVIMDKAFNQAAEAAVCWAEKGIEEAMRQAALLKV